MGKSMQERVFKAVSDALDDATKSLDGAKQSTSGGPLSGAKGVAAGAGAVALAPLAVKGLGKLVKVPGLGAVEDRLQSALSFGGDDDDDGNDGRPGVGSGRRMPVQQSVDIAVPIATAYNQWTQFETWPEFMQRVTRVNQEDHCTVSFVTKIWGKSKEFTAKIETQRPDERIKWRVTKGLAHTGVVTFHELAPRLTRIELTLDVEPGGMLEKAARGMRHIKRAARADLHRFKAYIEMQEQASDAWRGVIEDGKVVQQESAGRGERQRRRAGNGSRSSRSGRPSSNGSSGRRSRASSRS
jgi:uncharacterized membrane protein